MYIKELYKSGVPVVSLEVFPPRKESDIEKIYKALNEISELAPDFISVTYGAGGGGNVNKTAEIAAFIHREHAVSSLAHLTCVGMSSERLRQMLDDMTAAGVQNVLALRGDLPENAGDTGDYRYARDLISDIRERGDFCIGAACYPEMHIECEDWSLDTGYLRQKQEAGADFLISQLFFDNDIFFRFLDRARKGGINVPISAGVMPILSRKQIEQMIFLCGASLPSRIVKLLHKYENDPEDLRKAGVEYAIGQIESLLEQKVDGVHLYTMNKPDIARLCMKRIGRAR